MPTLEDFAKFDLKSFLDSLSQEEMLFVIKYLKDKGVI